MSKDSNKKSKKEKIMSMQDEMIIPAAPPPVVLPTQAITLTSGNELPSVTIKQGAKGNVTFDVKVYDKDIIEAKKKAKAIFDSLRLDYPE